METIKRILQEKITDRIVPGGCVDFWCKARRENRHDAENRGFLSR